MSEHIPQFALPELEGREDSARPRPGAYAVAIDADGRVLLVRALQGWFLPGGGVEAGEEFRDALVREVREETGYAATALDEIGRANQLVWSLAGDEVVNKLGRFFRVRTNGPPGPREEADHEPHWVDGQAAIAQLTEQAQAWAVERALGGPDGRTEEP